MIKVSIVLQVDRGATKTVTLQYSIFITNQC